MKKKILIILSAVIALWILTELVLSNTAVGATHYVFTSERLPEAFDGFKAAQISDLHNAEKGKDNSALVKILIEEKPDIIVFTGDMIDSSHTDTAVALSFAEKAVKIAPCYYVTGNHEARLGEVYDEFEKKLCKTGVTVLRDKAVNVFRGKSSIQLIGLDDPGFKSRDAYAQEGMTLSTLVELKDEHSFSVVLSHRPELFNAYTEAMADLVLSGHTHGGQIRLPFIGAVIAPDQGFFPKYDTGMFTQNNTSMIISQGIGNSVIPIRFMSKPEVVIAELHKK